MTATGIERETATEIGTGTGTEIGIETGTGMTVGGTTGMTAGTIAGVRVLENVGTVTGGHLRRLVLLQPTKSPVLRLHLRL